MEKAFHIIEWNFLTKVLRWFGFNNEFIELVNARVSENHFALLVNDSAASFFTMT